MVPAHENLVREFLNSVEECTNQCNDCGGNRLIEIIIRGCDNMVKFIGAIGPKVSYIDFNESQRYLIGTKGSGGEMLNKLLTLAERQGIELIITEQLAELDADMPHILEYNRALRGRRRIGPLKEPTHILTWRAGGIGAWRTL